jgi:site-specific recombinase XerD
MFENKKSDFVFCTSSGTKMRERKALSVCKDVAEKAELSSRAFLHKFRATYATVLVRNKVPLETIKELLGHSSVTITEKSYANNVSAGMFADVDVLDNIFD